MTTREVQNIINDINHPAADVTRHVFDEIRQLSSHSDAREFRQALSRINHDAHLTNLGFPSGSQLLGVSEENFEVRQRDGRIHNIDALTTRDRSQADSFSVQTNMVRQFHQRPDGSEYYTVQNGDTLSHIAQAALMERHEGARPTQTQIANFVNEIARANGMQITDVIRNQQTLLIPQGDRALTMAPQPLDGQVNPESPSLGRNQIPGLPSAHTGQEMRSSDGVRDRTVTASENQRGGLTYEYVGNLSDGTFSDTGFKAHEITDRSGNVVGREITYGDGNWRHATIDQTLQTSTGSVQLHDVRSIASERDAQGRWSTVFTTGDGRTRHALTDRTGAVRMLD